MRELGQRLRTRGRIYFTGGVSALLNGWRDMTVDIDCKFHPEPVGVFEVLPILKEELDVNVELAAPEDFIPVLPGWEERSKHIGTYGNISFFIMIITVRRWLKLRETMPETEETSPKCWRGN